MFQLFIDKRGDADFGDRILQFFLAREQQTAQAEQLKNQKAAQELNEKKFGLELQKFMAVRAAGQAVQIDQRAAIAEINAPTSPGALLAATDVLDVPSAEVSGLRRRAFPTQVEAGQDTVDLFNTGVALELIQNPRSGEELVQLVQDNPALGGALTILGADDTVKDLLNDLQAKQGEERRSRIGMRDFARKKGIEIAASTPGANAKAIGDAILDPSKEAGLDPASLAAVRQNRLIARSAAINKIRDTPAIRILSALQSSALADNKEDRAFAIQDLINKELTSALGPDVATLLPEFVKVPGREGVTDGGRSLITDPDELQAVDFLFNEHNGDLNAAIRQVQSGIAVLDPNDPNAIKAVAVMEFLQEFKGSPQLVPRILRGIRNIVKGGEPPVER